MTSGDYRIKGRSPVIRPRSEGGGGFHGARIFRSGARSSFSLPAGNTTLVTLIDTDYDTDAFVPGSPDGTLIIPSAFDGFLFRLSANVGLPTADLEASIAFNITNGLDWETDTIAEAKNSDGGYKALSLSGEHVLAAGAVVGLYCYSATGCSLRYDGFLAMSLHVLSSSPITSSVPIA